MTFSYYFPFCYKNYKTMSAFYHLFAVITIKKSFVIFRSILRPPPVPFLLCILHKFHTLFFIYLEIFTIYLHAVHNLFIFTKYNKYIVSQAKCRVAITHIDKFFHNSPGAERCLGTPHLRESAYTHYPGQNRKAAKAGILHV